MSGTSSGTSLMQRVIEAWRQASVSHAIAIERCGIAADGRPRNMRGIDLSPWTAPLYSAFEGVFLGAISYLIESSVKGLDKAAPGIAMQPNRSLAGLRPLRVSSPGRKPSGRCGGSEVRCESGAVPQL